MPSLKQRLLEVLLADDDDGSNDQAPDSPATDGAPIVAGESEAAPTAPPKPAQEPIKQDEEYRGTAQVNAGATRCAADGERHSQGYAPANTKQCIKFAKRTRCR